MKRRKHKAKLRRHARRRRFDKLLKAANYRCQQCFQPVARYKDILKIDSTALIKEVLNDGFIYYVIGNEKVKIRIATIEHMEGVCNNPDGLTILCWNCNHMKD